VLLRLQLDILLLQFLETQDLGFVQQVLLKLSIWLLLAVVLAQVHTAIHVLVAAVVVQAVSELALV